MSDNPTRPIDLETRACGSGGASFVVPASWPEQNRRRLELTFARRQRGLNAEEQVEYDRLQALADDVVDSMLPPLMLTPAERAYIDSKAGH